MDQNLQACDFLQIVAIFAVLQHSCLGGLGQMICVKLLPQEFKDQGFNLSQNSQLHNRISAKLKTLSVSHTSALVVFFYE